jgi:hypothetical protein
MEREMVDREKKEGYEDHSMREDSLKIQEFQEEENESELRSVSEEL